MISATLDDEPGLVRLALGDTQCVVTLNEATTLLLELQQVVTASAFVNPEAHERPR